MDKVETVYFVSWYLHNKNNNGWAYKVENKYTTKNAAEKAYYTLLGNYVGGDTFDVVVCILSDSRGEILEVKRWPELVPEDVIVNNNPETNNNEGGTT